ncbi:MAG: hypothetical protein ABIO16_12960 [Nocardioides sp.]
MSQLGDPSPGSAPAPTGGESPSDKPAEVPLWTIIVAGVVALALVALAGLMILRPPGRHTGAVGPLPTTTPSYPAAWNPRIKPIADKAASLRGLSFVHPVPVRFLPPATFEKTLGADQGQTSKKDRAELRHFTGLLRALGLLAGDVDLQKAVSDFQGGAVLAYYSFKDEKITVRGKKITPAIRATLIHELTHVLQDQNFHVGDELKQLDQQSDKDPTTSAGTVLQALIEGDAERVRYAYQAALPPAQRRALAAAQTREATEAQGRIADVPPLVVSELSSPYVLGPGLAQAAFDNGGNNAVDQLFREPPTHETALFDPFSVVTGKSLVTKVPVPSLQPGEKSFESGELGVLTWYYLLAERLPLTQALSAAAGWGGDAYVGFDRGATTCTRMSFAGRTPADTARMATALQQWAVATPGEQTVTAKGRLVDVASCDPGTAVPAAEDHSADAMTLLATRTAITLGVSKGGLPLAAARCVTDRLVNTFTLPQLNDPSFGRDDPAIQAQIAQLAASCR